MNRREIYRFRLYVAGETDNSVQAVANLTALCRAFLAGRSETEVVDVLHDPERALGDAVFMTPTLLKLGPLPVRRIVGTLNRKEAVLEASGIEGRTS